MARMRTLGLHGVVAGAAVLVAAAGCGRSTLDLFDRDGGLRLDGALPVVDGSSGDCTGDGDCDDGVYCNGVEQCSAGRCVVGSPVSCDDGVDCTNDSCIETARECQSVPDSARCSEGEICDVEAGCERKPCMNAGECNDGFACNGRERCREGFCEARPPLVCDDGIPCTTEVCVESAGGCQVTPDDAACDNRFFCDGVEVCNPDRGCVSGPPIDCNDRDRCTRDYCDEAGRSCVNEPTPDCGCSDFEDCTDGVDNDCNRLTDCDDPACAMDPSCMPCAPFEFDCSDRRDNDCDRQIDCDDPDCAGDPACGGCAPFEFDCRDGRDEDCDGPTDCDDPDCFGRPECGMPCAPLEFDCTDGRDDDCDGPTDCDDSDCFGRPECMVCTRRETACNDLLDNDCDGPTDCDDMDCAADSRCDCCRGGGGPCPPMIEICDNGVNDDCDDVADCDDPDCAMDPACRVTCPDEDLGSALGRSVARGTTRGAPRRFSASCGDGGREAPERAFRWQAPTAGTYRFTTAGSVYDTLLYLMRSCAGGELVCNDDVGGGVQSEVVYRLRAGQRVIVVVDGFGRGEGPFNLGIQRAPASEAGFCRDGIDNDADGPTDCADSDCAADPACCRPRPEICDNGRDDDCDLAADCADANCRFAPNCRPDAGPPDAGLPDAGPRDAGPRDGGLCTTREIGVAMCTDRLDNDCDRRRDCSDTDCSPFGAGGECCNGLDDDGDGQVDLFTCRCFADAECRSVGSLEQVCWTELYNVCAPRCNFYGGDSFCRMFGDTFRCNPRNGHCVPR